MTFFQASLKDILNNKISIEEIRNAFLELGIKNVLDFKQKKKSGELQVPSFDNLNALCLEKSGVKFENFFFGTTEINKKIQEKLIANIEKIRNWCIDNNVTTISEYRLAKRPKDFPTYKATIDNYGEEYFYEVLGLKRYKVNFTDKIIDKDFIKTIKEWCFENEIQSKRQYELNRPRHFPSLERIRQITKGTNYFPEFLKLNFKKDFLNYNLKLLLSEIS